MFVYNVYSIGGRSCVDPNKSSPSPAGDSQGVQSRRTQVSLLDVVPVHSYHMNMNNEPNVSAWTVQELRVELDRYEEELRAEGKPRNTITSYVYPVDRFLKWLDEPYRPIRAAPRSPFRDRPRTARDIVMTGDGGSLDKGAPPDEVGSLQTGR